MQERDMHFLKNPPICSVLYTVTTGLLKNTGCLSLVKSLMVLILLSTDLVFNSINPS